MIESFKAFNIQRITHRENEVADLMAIIGSHFYPATQLLGNEHSVQIVVRPVVLDNDIHWQVFESDEHIAIFIQKSEEFADQLQPKVSKAYGDQEIQLKTNKLPKGLITPKNLFDYEDGKNDKKKFTIDKGDYTELQVEDGWKLKVGKDVPQRDRERLIHFCDEYVGVITWSYDELKGYNLEVMQHTIELEEGENHVRQKQRPINPKIESLMSQELQKLISSKLIYPIKHNTQVSNLVSVQKKNRDIYLCVDFRDLNRASLKDHYPLTSMEQILHTVAWSKIFSMLDGFSSYNQVIIKPKDQHKTMFTTKWVTFAYQKMPFGLFNVGATFQRAMDISFRELINKIILIYLDYLTMFLKHKEDHFDHLELVFHKCLEFGVSLNPKKNIFGVPQGKFLGHAVSKEGVSIDPDHIKAIKELPLPVNKKGVQSFLGKINFVSRFIPDFVDMVRPIMLMLKKAMHFKWTAEAKEVFEKIKEAISSAPILANLDMSQDLIMYIFASDFSIAIVLTQKDMESKSEHPIAFHSKTLKAYEIK